MKVCVIGGGAAGLAAARHLTAPDSGFTCTLFERGDDVGGTWIYTDDVGVDQRGMPIHSSIYKSLMTNLPTEVMAYPDFPFVTEEDYVPAARVLEYIRQYKEHFHLQPYIQFHHHVTSVKPVDGAWEIAVVDLTSNEKEIHHFDAVMLCNGHYSTPNVPVVPGDFAGEILHCHDYRTPQRFADKTVVVVGAGHSARDIALEVSSLAKQVILSHHLKSPITNMNFPEQTLQKPDIASVAGTSVVFRDGSTCEADVILYCTGYLNDFGFLDASCSISVDDNFVQPLFKHMINIEHPTMCFIALPTYVSPFALAHIQAQYFLKLLKGAVSLPSREAMILDTRQEQEKRRSVPDYSNRKAHKMGSLFAAYSHDICDRAGIPRLPAVVFKRLEQSLCIQQLSFDPFASVACTK